MLGVGGGREVIDDAGARQLQVLALLVALQLFGGFGPRARFLLWCLRFFHLRFDVLAFPASCHSYSLTQFARACSAEAEIVARRKSGAGGASLRNNRERRAHDALHGAFSDARKVLGEN